MRRAFTLIEAVVVVAIIMLLTGMILGGVAVARRTAQHNAARALVGTVAAAISSYGMKSFELWPQGATDVRVARAWDIDGDSILDGIVEPPVYWRQPPAAANAATLAGLRYRGFAATTALPGLRGIRESDLVLLDPWKRPLRIAWAAHIYGDDGFCVWSSGRDPDDTADDIRSREQP